MATTPSRSSKRRRTKRPVGITNHPIEEELASQARVVPGAKKGETEPALLPRPDEHRPPRDPARRQRRAKYPPPE